jgi:hypothetical protein
MLLIRFLIKTQKKSLTNQTSYEIFAEGPFCGATYGIEKPMGEQPIVWSLLKSRSDLARANRDARTKLLSSSGAQRDSATPVSFAGHRHD